MRQAYDYWQDQPDSYSFRRLRPHREWGPADTEGFAAAAEQTAVRSPAGTPASPPGQSLRRSPQLVRTFFAAQRARHCGGGQCCCGRDCSRVSVPSSERRLVRLVAARHRLDRAELAGHVGLSYQEARKKCPTRCSGPEKFVSPCSKRKENASDALGRVSAAVSPRVPLTFECYAFANSRSESNLFDSRNKSRIRFVF